MRRADNTSPISLLTKRISLKRVYFNISAIPEIKIQSGERGSVSIFSPFLKSLANGFISMYKLLLIHVNARLPVLPFQFSFSCHGLPHPVVLAWTKMGQLQKSQRQCSPKRPVEVTFQ